jgi:hypothetical protein
MRLVISADRPRVPFKRGYITLTSPNAPSQSVRTWSDAPDRFSEGHFNGEGVEAMTSLSGRSMDLPSSIFLPWEFIANFTTRIVGAFKAYYNDETRMKSTTDKDVEEQAVKAGEDYHKVPDTLIESGSKFNSYRLIYQDPIEGDVDTTENFNETGRKTQMRDLV